MNVVYHVIQNVYLSAIALDRDNMPVAVCQWILCPHAKLLSVVTVGIVHHHHYLSSLHS